MIGARELSQKLHLLSQNLPNLLVESLNDLDSFVTDLNKNQLRLGYDSENNFLGYYSPVTIEIKEKEGKTIKSPNDEIALYDTGAFWNSIISNVVGLELVLDSENSKYTMLQSYYGKNILGLSKTSIEILTQKLCETLAEKIEKDVM